MIKEWLTRTADRGFGFLAALLMRRAVAPLARLNEHALHEAGLSRIAVADFLATPPGTDPGEFFTRHAQSGPVAPEQRLNGQPDARAGPKRRRSRRKSSSKSTLNLARKIP